MHVLQGRTAACSDDADARDELVVKEPKPEPEPAPTPAATAAAADDSAPLGMVRFAALAAARARPGRAAAAEASRRITTQLKPHASDTALVLEEAAEDGGSVVPRAAPAPPSSVHSDGASPAAASAAAPLARLTERQQLRRLAQQHEQEQAEQLQQQTLTERQARHDADRGAECVAKALSDVAQEDALGGTQQGGALGGVAAADAAAEQWVECDRCNKWRKLPDYVDLKVRCETPRS